MLRVISKFQASVPSIVRPISISSALKLKEGPNVDTVTHTGQVWDKDDYRRSRFIGGDKLVNPSHAINLIAEDPIVICTQRTVWSDSGGPLGHPKVYINLDKDEVAVCGYSGRKFIRSEYYNAAKHGPSITYEEYLSQVRPK